MSEAVTFADAVARIVSSTIIYVGTPDFAGETPYGLAVIETADGERQLVRLYNVGPDDLAIGAEVIFDHTDSHGPVYRLK